MRGILEPLHAATRRAPRLRSLLGEVAFSEEQNPLLRRPDSRTFSLLLRSKC